MYKKSVFSLLIVLFSLVAVVSITWADGIKERMKQRLPQIIQMKQQGIIGENDRGYLEYVSGNQPNQEIVEAENSDRQKVYEMIAKQQGVPIQKVEQLRAAQIVRKAIEGEMLKRSDGSWYKK